MKAEDKEYWTQLNSAFFESSSQFDKQVLFLAAGALGLSFAFIKDIVKLSAAMHKELLIISWSLLSIVILVNIISHYTSLRAINKRIENLLSTDDPDSIKLNFLTKIFNIFMIVAIAIALALLIIFVGINI